MHNLCKVDDWEQARSLTKNNYSSYFKFLERESLHSFMSFERSCAGELESSSENVKR